MSQAERPARVAYVLKMYPRLSETFIVNEILAHEAAGLDLEIVSLRQPVDGRFHAELARVRAPVTYLTHERLRASELWSALGAAASEFGDIAPLVVCTDDVNANDAFQAIELAQLIRARGITHLHAHFATAATTVARLAAHLAGIRYSFTAHAKDIYHETVIDDAMSEKLRDASSVVTVSDYNVEHLRTRFGAAASSVERIYNGLDLTAFPFRSPDAASRTVVGVGRLVEKKGFGDLIDACAILLSRGVQFHCDIVGGGPLRDALQMHVERTGTSECVTLLGARPRVEVVQRIQASALMAAPCVIGADGNRDGMPTVLLEAMALGTPCISTPVTGIPELIADGESGLLTPCGDPHALADRIQRLLDDRALATRLARAARTRIELDYDIHRNTAAQRRSFGAGAAAFVGERRGA